MKIFLQRRISLVACCLVLSCGSQSNGKKATPAAPWETPSSSIVDGKSPAPLDAIDPGTFPSPVPSLPQSSITTTFADIPSVARADTLEIGTWNIENYPKSRGSKAMVSAILKQMDVDIMAVEEISTATAFRELLAELPAYTGLLAGDNEGQNVGFIYKKADFKLARSEILFEGENYSFPRPALMVRLDPVDPSRADIVAIAVHLKAFGDDSSQQRRGIANEKLYEYVAAMKAREPKLQIAILGDFNQPLIETEGRQVFEPWFSRAGTFTVHTDALVRRGDYSYFSSYLQSLIDHIITTSDFPMDEPVIPKLQNIVPGYAVEASDHLPVVGRIL